MSLISRIKQVIHFNFGNVKCCPQSPHLCQRSIRIFEEEVGYPAKGLAWIVTSFIRVSVSGLNVFSLTGSFSSSSSVSRPSIILHVEESDVSAAMLSSCPSHTTTIYWFYRLLTFQTLCTSCPDGAVWHTLGKIGSRLCWGHCSPSRRLLAHYAEITRKQDTKVTVLDPDPSRYYVVKLPPNVGEQAQTQAGTHLEVFAVLVFKFAAPYTRSSFTCAYIVRRKTQQGVRMWVVTSQYERCSRGSDVLAPVGSPVWTMKPLMFRWKLQPL